MLCSVLYTCVFMYTYICRPALVYGKYQLAEYISVNLIELIEVTHIVMYMHVSAVSWTVMWEYADLAHVSER